MMKRLEITFYKTSSCLNFNFLKGLRNLNFTLSGVDRDFKILKNNFLFLSYAKYKFFIKVLTNISFSINSGYYNDIITQGVGFRFQRTKDSSLLLLMLGHSHKILIKIPKSIIIQLKKTRLMLFSFNKDLLNYTSKFIKSFRYPDAYKGKGLRFKFEKFKLKEGKKRQK